MCECLCECVCVLLCLFITSFAGGQVHLEGCLLLSRKNKTRFIEANCLNCDCFVCVCRKLVASGLFTPLGIIYFISIKCRIKKQVYGQCHAMDRNGVIE